MINFTPTLGLLLAALLSSFAASAQDCNCVIKRVDNEISRSPACDFPQSICGLELGKDLTIDVTEFKDLRDITIVLLGNTNPTFDGEALSSAKTQFDLRGGGSNVKILHPSGEKSYAKGNPNNDNSISFYNAELAKCNGTCSLIGPGRTNENYAVMPITLTDWTTTTKPGYVELQWHTAAERDNDRFRISRSTDGVAFQEVGEVLGTGTTEAGTDYTFRDLSAPQGLNYYRLEQFDFDGTRTDLGVQTAAWGTAVAAALSVSPNPVLAGALLGVHQATQEFARQAQLIGPDGRVIGSYAVSNGKIQLPQLAAGVYTIKIDNSTSRFVVMP